MHFRGSGSAVRFELCGSVDAWQRVVIPLWLGPDGGSRLSPDGKNTLGFSVQMEKHPWGAYWTGSDSARGWSVPALFEDGPVGGKASGPRFTHPGKVF